jgi:RecA-family ATPase
MSDYPHAPYAGPVTQTEKEYEESQKNRSPEEIEAEIKQQREDELAAQQAKYEASERDNWEEERRAPYYPADTMVGLFARPSPPIKEYIPKLIYAGAMSIIAGDPKAGKTTLLLHALNALASGKDFLWGKTHHPTVILYATEQNEVSFKEQAAQVPGLDQSTNFRAVLFEDNRYITQVPDGNTGKSYDKVFPTSWEKQVELWKEVIKRNNAKVFIIDTFTAFSNFKVGEGNDAGVVQARGQVLKQLLVDTPDLAIIILHHLRKEFNGRGGNMQARNFSDIANSYALRAMTDMNILIYRPSKKKELERVRTLKMEGRFIRGEETHQVELAENGKAFSICKKAIKEDDGWQDLLLEACIADPELNKLSNEALRKELDVPIRAVRKFRETYKKGSPIPAFPK